MTYRFLILGALLASTACTQPGTSVRTNAAAAVQDDGRWPAVVSRVRPDPEQERRVASILAKMSLGASICPLAIWLRTGSNSCVPERTCTVVTPLAT